IAFPYDGERFGGSNVSSLLLAQALRARGHAVHVITHGEGHTNLEASAMGLSVHVMPRLSATSAYARPDGFSLSSLYWLPCCMRSTSMSFTSMTWRCFVCGRCRRGYAAHRSSHTGAALTRRADQWIWGWHSPRPSSRSPAMRPSSYPCGLNARPRSPTMAFV